MSTCAVCAIAELPLLCVLYMMWLDDGRLCCVCCAAVLAEVQATPLLSWSERLAGGTTRVVKSSRTLDTGEQPEINGYSIYKSCDVKRGCG